MTDYYYYYYYYYYYRFLVFFCNLIYPAYNAHAPCYIIFLVLSGYNIIFHIIL